jgi:hypothetical protein
MSKVIKGNGQGTEKGIVKRPADDGFAVVLSDINEVYRLLVKHIHLYITFGL